MRHRGGMLAKAGSTSRVLECGAHWPYNDAALQARWPRAGEHPSALHNNCSGKHAGFVCLGCLMAGGTRRRGLPARLRASPTTR